ncbi:YqaE/Pmp3 family membrane protein [Aspergillus fijiensis CBS 313.89]|uniref:Putative stress response RCI peptide n=1 Tax=Aspergillus fijiensis CBS 313.89 TaxID=1448319 RepID=A0A8G1RW88_9EURO|nr:putative stress response RCI peptide [Aspergillus fijiensis CBS 313.89]RAK80349.1 putative stress response RCI peptide [Aspergillus fijiensis CBS 313.89]
MAGTCSMLCLILITIFIPPLGVFLISGCSADFFINLLLTLLGYLPGHIHAFYLEYVYYRNSDAVAPRRAPGVYSERIQRGAHHHHHQQQQQQQQAGYGTI